MRQRFSLLGLLSVLAAIVVFASACSGGGQNAAGGATVVRVNERDFRITVSPARIHAGNVQLVVHNGGPDTHELILVRSRARLPLRADGLTVHVVDQYNAGHRVRRDSRFDMRRTTLLEPPAEAGAADDRGRQSRFRA